MQRSYIKCMTHHDIRGFHLLDDDGVPYITVEALRIFPDNEPSHIDITIDLDAQGGERHPTQALPDEMKPHVNEAITNLRKHVGDLPLQFRKRSPSGNKVTGENWLR